MKVTPQYAARQCAKKKKETMSPAATPTIPTPAADSPDTRSTTGPGTNNHFDLAVLRDAAERAWLPIPIRALLTLVGLFLLIIAIHQQTMIDSSVPQQSPGVASNVVFNNVGYVFGLCLAVFLGTCLLGSR
jgi:hypothetical protein